MLLIRNYIKNDWETHSMGLIDLYKGWRKSKLPPHERVELSDILYVGLYLAEVHFPEDLLLAIENEKQDGYVDESIRARRDIKWKVVEDYENQGVTFSGATEGGFYLEGTMIELLYQREHHEGFASHMRLVRTKPDSDEAKLLLSVGLDYVNRLIDLHRERPWRQEQ